MLYMMIGISASGKSTYAQHLLDNGQADVLVSSDAIREELFGDASSQEDNKRVFEVFYKRIKDAYKRGDSVVADATFLTRKMRRRLIVETPKTVRIKAIVMANKRSACIEADNQRERHVGVDVIDKQINRFEMPLLSEGIDEIEIINRWTHVHNSTEMYEEKIGNPHHKNDDLSSHCFAVRSRLMNKLDDADIFNPLVVAGLFHDVGFKWTRSVDEDGVCHYYNHPNVGAYWFLTRRNNFMTLEERIRTIQIINYHMFPYFWDEEKIRDYFEHDNGLAEDLLILNKADMESM